MSKFPSLVITLFFWGGGGGGGWLKLFPRMWVLQEIPENVYYITMMVGWGRWLHSRYIMNVLVNIHACNELISTINKMSTIFEKWNTTFSFSRNWKEVVPLDSDFPLFPRNTGRAFFRWMYELTFRPEQPVFQNKRWRDDLLEAHGLPITSISFVAWKIQPVF